LITVDEGVSGGEVGEGAAFDAIDVASGVGDWQAGVASTIARAVVASVSLR
jgi:hypothetical protein